MNVDILAHTYMRPHTLSGAYDYDQWGGEHNKSAVSHADALSEAAGRLCYRSFERKRAETASNRGYLANILEQGHYSVLEHASVTFLIRDVSRALLTELTRHRHLSFSVVSQRYVDYANTEPVIPPALRGTFGESAVRYSYAHALARYELMARELQANGLTRKQAREAARCVLPNAAPVDMIVTGNLRAWRDVLGKRWHVAADAEIRECAGLILEHLRGIAPNAVQDVPESPYE